MAIFNSLGSNYDFSSVIEAVTVPNRESSDILLKKALEERYGGQAILLYKGREAIRLALRLISSSSEFVKGDESRSHSSRQARTIKHAVGICGFTCYAVYDAVVQEGYDVEYLDIDPETLHFSFATLQSAVKKNPHLKIIIIQNTLGYSCEMEKIAKFCREKNIILIEDLAHSIGTVYSNGKEAGTVGDFVVLSFSQDKVVDGVSGGALVVRQQELRSKIKEVRFVDISQKQQSTDRMYPLYTWLIRKTYDFGLGKMLHLFLKKINALSRPMDNLSQNALHALPFWYSYLIHQGFRDLPANLDHRRKIAKIYISSLSAKGGSAFGGRHFDDVESSTNLRFPIFVQDRASLITHLKKHQIFVSDIWYDSPIGPKKYLSLTDYQKGQCPNAEKVSQTMLNLPTHKNVSEKEARFIVDKINEWMRLPRP